MFNLQDLAIAAYYSSMGRKKFDSLPFLWLILLFIIFDFVNPTGRPERFS